DDAIRAEPVPDIGPPLELLAVAGSALEGVQLVALTQALAGARLTAAELARLARDAPRTAALRVDPPPKEIETRLARSLDAEGVVLRVLRELTDLLRPHRAALAAAWEMCIAFDDLCARARYAVEVNGFAPAIGAGPLAIRNGRHPLLVPPLRIAERGSGGEDVVP